MWRDLRRIQCRASRQDLQSGAHRAGQRCPRAILHCRAPPMSLRQVAPGSGECSGSRKCQPPILLPGVCASRPHHRAGYRPRGQAGRGRSRRAAARRVLGNFANNLPNRFFVWHGSILCQGYLRPEGVRKVRKGLKNAAFCIVGSLKTLASGSSRASWCSKSGSAAALQDRTE